MAQNWWISVMVSCIILLTITSIQMAEIKHEQVHLSLGTNENEMLITWVTISLIHNGIPQVQFGLNSESLSQKQDAETEKFSHIFTKFYTHRALLTNLEPDTVYYYRVGSPATSTWSKVFQFRTLKFGPSWNPTVAIYGDFGLQNGQSLEFLKKETAEDRYDTIFHIGDFAYDLQERNGKQGHDFMNAIEPIAARVPYMTCPGNHEFFGNFTHYDGRFSMLGDRHQPNPGAPLRHRLNNHFWSVDIGPAHFILFSTEFYDFTIYGWHQIEQQYHFLEQDLKRANENRAQRPWIIVMGHKPMYIPNAFDWSVKSSRERSKQRSGVHMRANLVKPKQYGLEELFYRYGVDMQFYGHDHSYCRMLPLYNFEVFNGNNASNHYENPKGPIHIVSGGAGNREVDTLWDDKTPAWIVKRSLDYGYTRLQFKSANHLLMKQLSVNKNGEVIDQIDIIKTDLTPNWIKFL